MWRNCFYHFSTHICVSVSVEVFGVKIIFSDKYKEVYSSDPAASKGRMEVVVEELRTTSFEFVQPQPASETDLNLVHWQTHIETVKSTKKIYDAAVLAAGGAIAASEYAIHGEPAFGLIRPPGHHASQNSSWGFCFFNNIAISVEKLLKKGSVEKVLIVDFDLHFGDGTAEIFATNPNVIYHHAEGSSRENLIERLAEWLRSQKGFDVVAVSAGFDGHEQDWGGMLTTADYETIGKLIRASSERECSGRRYAVLEGGYNTVVLGKNVKAFLEGFK